MTLIIVVSSLTLFGSFLCSLFEAALYAITPSQLALLLEQKRSGAQKLAALRADVEEPIAAILTINTITHTVGASVCGALVADHFGGNTAVGIFAAIFTVAVLVLTEIIPKSYGVRHAVRLAPLIVWPLQVMIWSVWPIVKTSGWLMRLLMGGKGHAGPTEDEVVVMSKLAAEGGALRPEERRWVERALRLDQVSAKDLLTPRPVVERVEADTTVGELREVAPDWTHSRLPVIENQDVDSVVGVVMRREVMNALVRGEDAKTIRELMFEPRFVTEQERANQLLDHFIAERRHLVVVRSEFGGFSGIVTLEDVIEEMLGSEIVDEVDEVADPQAYARRRARLEGAGQ
jgi:CBS domain containing-hemolysin-like protein